MRFSFRSRFSLFLVLLLLLTAGIGLLASYRGVAQAANTQRIWLSQKVGPPTASMQLNGSGFGQNETVNVNFDTTQIGIATTDAAGTFVVRVSVPKTALPGTHAVQAAGQSSGLTASASFLVRTDWAQFHFGPYHTGYNPYENVLSSSNVSKLTREWNFTTGGSIGSSPAVANGVVYIGSSDQALYALDAATGSLKWSYATGGYIVSSPAVANGVVYFGAADNYQNTDDHVYALDALTGALKWSLKTGGYVDSSPAIANGVVYVGSQDDNVYAFHLPGMS